MVYPPIVPPLVQKIIFFAAVFIALVVCLIPVVKSGREYSFGIGFWGPNGHDAVWHLSLINNFRHPWRLELPIMEGEILKNYHPFYNILLGSVSRFTGLSGSILYFQIFPPILSLLFLLLSFRLGYLLTRNYWGGILLMLFNVSLNSFGWLVTLIRSGDFYGESLFWSMQPSSNLINPPFFLSLILLTWLLILLLTQKPHYQFYSFLILIILPITKVYAAPLAFILVFADSYLRFKNSRNYQIFIWPVLALVFSLIVYLHYNPLSSSLLHFQPGWFLRTLVDSPDKLYLPWFSTFLANSSLADPRSWLLYLILVVVFVVGNFGFRILGFFQYPHLHHPLEKTVYWLSLGYLLVPLLFIQSGTPWNTIQFVYYSLFIQSLFLVKYLVHRRQLLLSLAILFINFLIVGLTSKTYLDSIPPAALPVNEIAALQFLRQQSPGTVLTVPYNAYWKNSFPTSPLPLFSYDTTAYVSAFSSHPVYLEDEMNLHNSGYDIASRRLPALEFFDGQDRFRDRGFLVNNRIDYIYIADNSVQIPRLDQDHLYLTEIFRRQQTVIYKVQR